MITRVSQSRNQPKIFWGGQNVWFSAKNSILVGDAASQSAVQNY